MDSEDGMKSSELARFKERLLALRARCTGDVNQLADEGLRRGEDGVAGNLSNLPLHLADVGSDNFEQEFTLSLLQNEEKLLAEIDAALGRIAKGTYGICEQCGAAIPKERLKAVPYTAYCVNCARKLEERS
jgi:DnaK suppressor protein